MITVLAFAWVALSPILGLLVGGAVRIADQGGPKQLPARLSPRAELPSPERALLVLGVLAAVLLAFATRGQVVTWDGLVAVPA